MAGEGVTWTPTSGGAAAETSYKFKSRTSATATQDVAILPVRISTSNEVTKAGIARSVIKAEAYLDSALQQQSVGGNPSTVKSMPYTKTLTPVQVHLVVSAPRGAAQLALEDNEAGLGGLVSFLFGNLLTILTGRSSDETTIDPWEADKLMNALRGSQLFDPVSGSYGKDS
jgi:hypothetical protein